jgi:GNAT superfamily N-acetyltransferase
MILSAQTRHLEAIAGELPGIVASMRAAGNDQWGPGYPTAEHFAADLAAGHLFVDVEDGGVRGFGVFNEIEPEEYGPLPWTVPRPALIIHRLAVCPAFRRQGVAENLFAFAEAMARERRQGLRSDTYSRNPAMNALFAKRGWRLVGKLEFPGREADFRAWEKPLE